MTKHTHFRFYFPGLILAAMAYFVATSKCYSVERFDALKPNTLSVLREKGYLLQDPPQDLKLLLKERNDEMMANRPLDNLREARIRDLIIAKGKGGGADAGGGGTGLICFQTTQDANQSRDERGLLKPDYITRTHNIEVIDFIRGPSDLRMYEFLAGETPKDFLFRILNNYLPAANPMFIEKLKDYINTIASTWEEKTGPFPILKDFRLMNNWPLLQDFNPTQNWPNCFYVQIAIRKSVMWEENGMLYSAFFLEVDRALLNSIRTNHNPKSRIFGEASLLLHEAIYQIAKEFGHNNANQSHELFNFLMNERTLQTIQRSADPQEFFHRNLCQMDFAKSGCYFPFSDPTRNTK